MPYLVLDYAQLRLGALLMMHRYRIYAVTVKRLASSSSALVVENPHSS